MVIVGMVRTDCDCCCGLLQAAAKALSLLCHINPTHFRAVYSGRLSWLLTWLVNDHERLRTHIADVIGVAASDTGSAESASLLTTLYDMARADSGPRYLSHKHGAILALGQVLGLSLKAVSTSLGAAPSTVSQSLQLLHDSLSHADLYVREAAATSLTIVARAGCLPISADSDALSRRGIVDKLAVLSLGGMAGGTENTASETVALTRVVQAFATCLGAFAYHDDDSTLRTKAVDVSVELGRDLSD